MTCPAQRLLSPVPGRVEPFEESKGWVIKLRGEKSERPMLYRLILINLSEMEGNC